MSRKQKYSKEVKIKACEEYLSGKKSVIQIAYDINPSANRLKNRIIEWTKLYKAYGPRIFDKKRNNGSYSKEFKTKVVSEYLKGNNSLFELQLKYKISSTENIRRWIIMYNSGKELQDYSPKSEVYTMKSKKVTLEEKKEIINYVLVNNNDYKGAADKYTVSYHNVYQWVRNYLNRGAESLNDKRGRKSKENKELSEVDKLKIELQKQKEINAKLQLANEILKKNIEIAKKLEKDFQK